MTGRCVKRMAACRSEVLCGRGGCAISFYSCSKCCKPTMRAARLCGSKTGIARVARTMASGYRCVRNEYRCDANSGEVDSTGFDGGGQLLPLDYDELRKLAAARLAHEKPGQTLQATALVHEAYLRLAGGAQAGKTWDGRGHSSRRPRKRCLVFWWTPLGESSGCGMVVI